MKATEQYFPVVLFIMLYKVILTFESVDKILKCDHSNESYWAVPSCDAVYYVVQVGSVTFKFVDKHSISVTILRKLKFLFLNMLDSILGAQRKSEKLLIHNSGQIFVSDFSV